MTTAPTTTNDIDLEEEGGFRGRIRQMKSQNVPKEKKTGKNE